jgi:hypothetical protein
LDNDRSDLRLVATGCNHGLHSSVVTLATSTAGASAVGSSATAADGVDERVSVLLEAGIVRLRSLLSATFTPVVDPAVVAGGDLTPDLSERLLALSEDEVD